MPKPYGFGVGEWREGVIENDLGFHGTILFRIRKALFDGNHEVDIKNLATNWLAVSL